MFFKKLFFPLLFITLMLSSAVLGGVTYAFWRDSITVENNIIETGELKLSVNLRKAGTTQIPYLIENLYPSYVHYEIREMDIINTGSINLKYRVNFEYVVPQDVTGDYTISPNYIAFENVLVNVNNKVDTENNLVWERLSSIVLYNDINDFLNISESDTWNFKFKLDPMLEDLATMNQMIRFSICVSAIQTEDSFN